MRTKLKNLAILSLVALSLFVGISSVSASLEPVEEWNKTFGGLSSDYGDSVQQTKDGGYIVVGRTKSFGAGDYDFYLVKTYENGTPEWSTTFGGGRYENGHSVQQTADGGYIVVGVTISFGVGDYDVYIIKTYENGTMEWSKTFDVTTNDLGNSVQQTTDGGYIIAGSTGSGNDDVFLIKTHPDGTKQWSKTFGSSGTESGFSVQQTTDGGYVIGGSSNSFGAGNYDVYLIKTYPNGTEQWSKTFGGLGNDQSFSVQQTSDGGYVLAGWTNSFGAGNYDVYLVKTYPDGTEQWSKTFGGSGRDDGFSVRQTSDSGYIIVGYSNSFGTGDYDVYLIKTDQNGNEEWNRTLKGTGEDRGLSVIQTTDGGYVLAGFTNSYGAGGYDAWLIKLKESVSNNPPTLTSGSVSPGSGDASTSFTYSVIYTDSENDPPTKSSIIIDGSTYEMTTMDTTYTDGSEFTYTTTLPEGDHDFYFLFNDGTHGDVRAPSTGVYSGPTVQEQSTISISGFVYKNEDGTSDYEPISDIPIPNANVKVISSYGVVVSSYTTDENGYYSISNIPAGLYSFEVSYDLCGQNAIQVAEPVVLLLLQDNSQIDINVTYLSVNCSSDSDPDLDDYYELWHYGPVFDKENVVLVHGLQHCGISANLIGAPDHHFHELHNLMQKRSNGQYNVWLYEYANDSGHTKGRCEDYAISLKEAIETINVINNEKDSNEGVSAVIAHSMGGIVARKCLQDNPSLQTDIKLLTLATGHFGFERKDLLRWCPGFYESYKDCQIAGSYLWNLSFNYQDGSYVVASIVATDDKYVEASSASLIQSPDNPAATILYPENYYFRTVDSGGHRINQIQTENEVFGYIKQFLEGDMSSFNQRPSAFGVSYVIFCYSHQERPVIRSYEIGKPPVTTDNFAFTAGERCRAIGSDGELSDGWIFYYPAGSGVEGIDIEDEFVKITKGQSMIVKKLIGPAIEIEIPAVALVIAPISAEEGGFVMAGADGQYTKHSISISAGALSEDTVMFISEPANNHGLLTAVEFGPDGTIFSEPATVTTEYKDSDVPQGHDESEMRLLVWEDDTWKDIPGSTINLEENTVSGNVEHISLYAAGIPEHPTEPIPEFTTIALPVTVIISLLFLFNHHRRKEH